MITKRTLLQKHLRKQLVNPLQGDRRNQTFRRVRRGPTWLAKCDTCDTWACSHDENSTRQLRCSVLFVLSSTTMLFLTQMLSFLVIRTRVFCFLKPYPFGGILGRA